MSHLSGFLSHTKFIVKSRINLQAIKEISLIRQIKTCQNHWKKMSLSNTNYLQKLLFIIQEYFQEPSSKQVINKPIKVIEIEKYSAFEGEVLNQKFL